jgi:hypothetical protein
LVAVTQVVRTVVDTELVTVAQLESTSPKPAFWCCSFVHAEVDPVTVVVVSVRVVVEVSNIDWASSRALAGGVNAAVVRLEPLVVDAHAGGGLATVGEVIDAVGRHAFT